METKRWRVIAEERSTEEVWAAVRRETGLTDEQLIRNALRKMRRMRTGHPGSKGPLDTALATEQRPADEIDEGRPPGPRRSGARG
jgi:hypothetical protein